MKRQELGLTYDADSLTSVGFVVELARRRCGSYAIVLRTRNRWSGSRNNDEYWVTPVNESGFSFDEALEFAWWYLEDENNRMFLQPLIDAATKYNTTEHGAVYTVQLKKVGHVVY